MVLSWIPQHSLIWKTAIKWQKYINFSSSIVSWEVLLTLFQWGSDAWAWSSSIIDFCTFSWGRQQGHPSPGYIQSSQGCSKHRHWESCSESRGFPTALCRHFSKGIWLPLLFSPSGRNSPLGLGWEGAGRAEHSPSGAGRFVPCESSAFSSFCNRKIFPSWCFWHCLTWCLGAGDHCAEHLGNHVGMNNSSFKRSVAWQCAREASVAPLFDINF